MILVCQQPNYLPWIGYFEQIARADKFVFLDSVQWIKQGRQHRTKLPGPVKSRWLTLPVKSKNHRQKQIKDMVVEPGWTKYHWAILKNQYHKNPYFSSQVEPILRPFFEKMKDEKFLIEICQESIFCFWDFFQLKAELQWSSELTLTGIKSERLVSACESLNATEYYSALGSTRYLDTKLFLSKGIQVRWQHLKAFYPNEINRPTDFSIVDWLSLLDASEVKKMIKPKNYSTTELATFL